MEDQVKKFLKNNENLLEDKEIAGRWEAIKLAMIEKYDKVTESKRYFLEDPLSKHTRSYFIKLIIATCSLLITFTYGLSISSIVNDKVINNVDKKDYLLVGILGVIVSYYFVSYLFSYIHDITKLYVSKNEILHESMNIPLLKISECVSKIKIIVERTNIEQKNRFLEHIDKGTQFIEMYKSHYNKLAALVVFNKLLFFVRTFVWEFLFPVCLSIATLCLALDSMISVFKDILSVLIKGLFG